MFKSNSFSFNGITSDTMECFIGTLNSSGARESAFGIGGVTIVQDTMEGLDRPYYSKKHITPMEFSISLFPLGKSSFSNSDMVNMASWLFYEDYKDFISDDDTSIIYKCICSESEKIIIGSDVIGFNLTFTCNSPYAYLEEQVDTYSVSTSMSISIDTRNSNYTKNFTDLEIEFTLGGTNTDISIENEDDSRELTFTSLDTLETIYIHNGRRKEIISDSGEERAQNSNLVWLRLLPNTNNTITITGQCEITFRYQLPMYV